MLRSGALALLAAAGLVAVAACGTDNVDANILSAGGWPGAHSDARNSDTSTVTGPRDLSLTWSRPIGGTVATSTSISANGQMYLTSRTAGGCNFFSFQMPTGRKRFCVHLNDGVASSTPVIDGATHVYVGDGGAMNSFTDHGQWRWRTPVVGTPLAAQFTGDGNLLSITQLGQVNVLSRHTGAHVVPPFDILGHSDFLATPNLPWPSPTQGMSDCFLGGPQCPVANTPAIDLATGRFYVTLWRPGAPEASLIALRYADGKITREWHAEILARGSATSPTLSADGKTVYVGDNANHLLAVDAATGRTKWTYDLGFTPVGAVSVSADGLLIPASRTNGHLLAIRDKGDHAEPVWERKDLAQFGVPAQAKGDTGYAVVGTGGSDGALSLLTFDTSTGATIDQDTLPNAHGATVATSVGPGGEVLTSTLIGELYCLKGS